MPRLSSVAGRIRDEDIAAVRDKSPIAEIIGEHVQLRSAGGGNLKGICPFHEEKSPSLSVSPANGLFHCFGCGAGGDVIRFVERIEHLGFGEAVERLAARAGIPLRYLDSGAPGPRRANQTARLIEANAAAAKFYAEQLATPEAAPARDFLTERGFDDAAAATYGCGYAPSGWDVLTKHLLARKFTPEELQLAGLARTSERGGLIDRFHRRLLWPIRDVSGDVVGFGARRLFDDDRIDAKYLNTPETPIYKKSRLLYGMDLAKREIAKQRRAVIVEGYTDVMACHLAGVPTAVATCGTAFGDEHIAVLRRLLMDSEQSRGHVIFTFDGDAAGIKAAERAFAEDQKFLSHTWVAVEPNGLDPCELRQKSGDAAVRQLVDSGVLLVEFMLRTTNARYDLDTPEGRNEALRRGVPIVARIKDLGLRDQYAGRLAGLVGELDPNEVVTRVRRSARSGGKSEDSTRRPAASPVIDETTASVEREALKIALQLPSVAGPEFDALPEEAFLVGAHRELRRAILASGGVARASGGASWVAALAEHLPDGDARTLINALAVEPLRTNLPAEQYADAVLARVQELVVGREVRELKARVQRMNPLDEPEKHARLFAEMIALEGQQRSLRERALGSA